MDLEQSQAVIEARHSRPQEIQERERRIAAKRQSCATWIKRLDGLLGMVGRENRRHPESAFDTRDRLFQAHLEADNKLKTLHQVEREALVNVYNHDLHNAGTIYSPLLNEAEVRAKYVTALAQLELDQQKEMDQLYKDQAFELYELAAKPTFATVDYLKRVMHDTSKSLELVAWEMESLLDKGSLGERGYTANLSDDKYFAKISADLKNLEVRKADIEAKHNTKSQTQVDLLSKDVADAEAAKAKEAIAIHSLNFDYAWTMLRKYSEMELYLEALYHKILAADLNMKTNDESMLSEKLDTMIGLLKLSKDDDGEH